MIKVEVDFEKYLPHLETFYRCLDILKYHNFIKNVEVIENIQKFKYKSKYLIKVTGHEEKEKLEKNLLEFII